MFLGTVQELQALKAAAEILNLKVRLQYALVCCKNLNIS